MAGLFDILNVSPAERVQPTMPTGLQGIAQTLSGVANRGVQQAAGQDTRTVEAKLNSAMQGADLATTKGLIAAAQSLDAAGEGIRAAEFRRMAAEMQAKQDIIKRENDAITEQEEIEDELYGLVQERADSLGTTSAQIIAKSLQAGQLTGAEALDALEKENPTARDLQGRLRYIGSGDFVFESDAEAAGDREWLKASNGIHYFIDDNTYVIQDVGERAMAKIQDEDLAAVRAVEDANLRAAQADTAALGQVSLIRGNIATIKALLPTAPAGYLGSAQAALRPTSPSGKIRRVILTLVSNIGFDKLQAMRDASPTGGALGQVSERELSTLQAVLGNLDAQSTDEEMILALDEIEKFYGRLETNTNEWRELREGRNTSSTTGDEALNSLGSGQFGTGSFSGRGPLRGLGN